MNVSEVPLQRVKAYFSEATFFNELLKNGNVTLACMPLSKWEAYEKLVHNSTEKALPPSILLYLEVDEA